jgi:diguanylate cyclase (GGDEF)-like protein
VLIQISFWRFPLSGTCIRIDIPSKEILPVASTFTHRIENPTMIVPTRTIGVLPGWPVYEAVRMDRFLKSVLTGIREAAADHGCNLMVACGVNRIPGTRSLRTAWPIDAVDCDFIPVGEWNTDGLILLSPLRSEERRRHIRRLIQENFPVLFIGSGEGGPSVQVDNEGGMRQAVEHLVKHGHRRIAFIAGDPLDLGDSALRLRAYRAALEEFEVEFDPRLVANGYHNMEFGRRAMEQILVAGSPFTAVVTSNDSSAFGALQVLQSAGRRVPTDVALVSFDDQPFADGQVPPLTSVHYPIAEITRRAVESLLALIENPKSPLPEETRIPTRLVVRQSCGCAAPYRMRPARTGSLETEPGDADAVAVAMLEGLHRQPGHLPRETTLSICRKLIHAFHKSLTAKDGSEFHRTLQEMLIVVERAENQVAPWQEVISILRAKLLPPLTPPDRLFGEDLLHQARLLILDGSARQSLRGQIQTGELNSRISGMATRMFNAKTEADILRIFQEILPDLGIRFGRVFFFESKKHDRFGGLRFQEDATPGEAESGVGESRAMCNETRDFPPPEACGPDSPYYLMLLPLVCQEDPIGFVVFDGATPEPLASIVREMAAALKGLSIRNQVEELSLSDNLTGVQNQRFFLHFLEREVERCRRYGRTMSLMMMDLDGFAAYNHTHGPERGDDALRAIAKCVSSAARRGSDIVCRYEGDAFAVILPETDRDGALRVAETIRARIRRCDGLNGDLSVSIGVAVADIEAFESNHLMDCAGRAMYHAKTAGRNQTVALAVSSQAG